MKRHVRSLYSKIGAWLLLDFSVGCLLCLINSQDDGLMQHLNSFACCVILHAFWLSADTLSGESFITVSNSLDPDQARQHLGPDLDPNCLLRLLADDD